MKLRPFIAVCVLAALAISAFLTWERARGGVVPCPVGGGCETVAASPYAHLLGLPVSLYGIVGATLLLGTFLLPRDPGIQARLSIALVGATFSAYLTYLEAARIHAYCAWCVTSAILWCVLLGASLADVWRTENPRRALGADADDTDARTPDAQAMKCSSPGGPP